MRMGMKMRMGMRVGWGYLSHRILRQVRAPSGLGTVSPKALLAHKARPDRQRRNW